MGPTTAHTVGTAESGADGALLISTPRCSFCATGHPIGILCTWLPPDLNYATLIGSRLKNALLSGFWLLAYRRISALYPSAQKESFR